MHIDNDDSMFAYPSTKGRQSPHMDAVRRLAVGEVLHIEAGPVVRKFAANIKAAPPKWGEFDYRTFGGMIHIKRIK